MSLSYPLPGIYRQDVYPQPPPLFLTGVPVFLGYAAAGNFNQPARLSEWQQFEAQFGAAAGYLAAAVSGFFANGGFLCYVVRLADSDDVGNDLAQGLAAVASLEEVDLVCAPDLIWAAAMQAGQLPDKDNVAPLQQQLLDHCRQVGNQFCLLDGLPFAVSQVIAQRAALQGELGALYYPWLLTADNRLVPPCGHVAGIYSRTDQIMGVHKAPANEIVNGVVDLGMVVAESILPITLSNDEQASLSSQNINYLQAFPGRGIRLWGARTLSPDPTWQQVNVRRLFITIGRWLECFMADLTFTNHRTQLWVRIVRQISAYLDDLFRQGALKGQTAEQAFFVKCDAETNPPELYESGVVVTQIGLAAAVPAEFIVVRVVQSITGTTVQT